MVGYAAGGADVAVTGVAICLNKDVVIDYIDEKAQIEQSMAASDWARKIGDGLNGDGEQ
ncbi:MAG: hypothetical protein Q7S71_04885 [Candidatus Nitrotoga sp.]|nr:hypothetical protein [Candidatus Nitrotoga sp.]